MYTNSCIAPCTHTHQHAALYTPSATHSLHPGYSHPLFRSYHNLSANAKLHTQELMYPIFVHEQDDLKEQITSLPNQFRWGVNRLVYSHHDFILSISVPYDSYILISIYNER